jgi:hypothetical protein
MNQLIEFKNREIRFIPKEEGFVKSGYQISSSENYELLQKILKIDGKKYNSYTTIATYGEVPRFPLELNSHMKEFKEWVKINDETITSIDFFLDFDGEPTIEGLTKAWKDVQTAQKMLPLIIGEQAKYLQIWFSGNKGFHILGKCRNVPVAQKNIETQYKIAEQLEPLCKTIDLTIYDTKRIRKLLGSYVYSVNFGKTRVIPIANDTEFKELITALETKNEQWFQKKRIYQLNGINI